MHLFTIGIKFSSLKINKFDLFKYMIKKKIILQQHYIPINKFKISMIKKIFKFKFFFKNSFSLPIHYLSKKQQLLVVNELIKFLKINKK